MLWPVVRSHGKPGQSPGHPKVPFLIKAELQVWVWILWHKRKDYGAAVATQRNSRISVGEMESLYDNHSVVKWQLP